ncbi:MAG: amidohydrolase family protein [Gammaproteobacteria bacterium]|nr:amidohydrolase family protein [Gammaproteobacteria bacterium]MDH5345172.1 amidohydrolase family protein [Gammaproteobacteria bacterium]
MPMRILPLVILAVSTMAAAQESLRPDVPVAIVGGMLLDGYEAEPIHHSVVIFENGRIIAVGQKHDTEIPANAVVIDAGGRTVMPGLIDAHMHIDLIGHGSYERYYEFMGGMENIGRFMQVAAKQMMRAGVTSALDLGAPFQAFDFRDRIRRGEIPGPRLTLSGPWITRIDYDTIPDEYEIVINSPREAAARTRELIDRGVDVIKVWVGLTEADYRAVVEEAHKSGIRVHAHLYDPAAIRMAIDAGVDVFQHVGSARNPPYDEALVAEIAHRNIPIVQTIAHRIWVYPATVAFPEKLYDPVYRDDMPADIYEEFIASFENWHRLSYYHDIGQETRNARRSASQFIDAGAYMGVGTDAASPLNMHDQAMWREMSALVEAGMTPIQVISAATKTNAEILGQFDELGTIEPGKLADIIIVDGDPLRNVEVLDYVDIVIKDGGVWYSERAAYGPVTEIGHAF